MATSWQLGEIRLVGEDRESYGASWAVNMFGENMHILYFIYDIYFIYICLCLCMYRGFDFSLGQDGWYLSVSLLSPMVHVQKNRHTKSHSRRMMKKNKILV